MTVKRICTTLFILVDVIICTHGLQNREVNTNESSIFFSFWQKWSAWILLSFIKEGFIHVLSYINLQVAAYASDYYLCQLIQKEFNNTKSHYIHISHISQSNRGKLQNSRMKKRVRSTLFLIVYIKSKTISLCTFCFKNKITLSWLGIKAFFF